MYSDSTVSLDLTPHRSPQGHLFFCWSFPTRRDSAGCTLAREERINFRSPGKPLTNVFNHLDGMHHLALGGDMEDPDLPAHDMFYDLPSCIIVAVWLINMNQYLSHSGLCKEYLAVLILMIFAGDTHHVRPLHWRCQSPWLGLKIS